MVQKRFSLTYDYRCPFARIANDHVITALQAGAPYEVHFQPFVLGSEYGAEGNPAIWDDSSERPQLLALAASVVVRDHLPIRFLDVQRGLFELRHDSGGDLRDDVSVRSVLTKAGVDADFVYQELDDGWPYKTIRTEHESAIADYQVFGVPTFIANGKAAFVRLMARPLGDTVLATTTVERIYQLLTEHPDINEFKHTSIPR